MCVLSGGPSQFFGKFYRKYRYGTIWSGACVCVCVPGRWVMIGFGRFFGTLRTPFCWSLPLVQGMCKLGERWRDGGCSICAYPQTCIFHLVAAAVAVWDIWIIKVYGMGWKFCMLLGFKREFQIPVPTLSSFKPFRARVFVCVSVLLFCSPINRVTRQRLNSYPFEALLDRIYSHAPRAWGGGYRYPFGGDFDFQLPPFKGGGQ